MFKKESIINLLFVIIPILSLIIALWFGWPNPHYLPYMLLTSFVERAESSREHETKRDPSPTPLPSVFCVAGLS
jgi:hypothetical protein